MIFSFYTELSISTLKGPRNLFEIEFKKSLLPVKDFKVPGIDSRAYCISTCISYRFLNNVSFLRSQIFFRYYYFKWIFGTTGWSRKNIFRAIYSSTSNSNFCEP